MAKYSIDQYRQVVRMLGFRGDYSAIDTFFKCPKHSDRRPSLAVNFEKGIFQCFQCGYAGTISTLAWDRCNKTIDHLLGLKNDDKKILDFCKSNEDTTILESERVDLSKVHFDVRGILVPFEESKEALAYIKERHLAFEILKSVNATYSGSAMINNINFSNRLIIPIYEHTGQIVNYEGRDTTFKSPRKCVYPKGAIKPLFEHYKLDHSKPIFVFEGLLKVLGARSDPYFANSTTSMGTSISSYQLEQLKPFKKIVICPDNDAAGKVLIKRIKDNLSATSSISVLRISDMNIKDIDEIPKKTGLTVAKYREQGGFYEDISF